MARTIRQAPATAPGVAAKAQQATGKRLQDALAPYRRRRDFRTTPEPRDEAAARPRRVAGRHGRALAFVVQKHAARRLHYDFRLELDGTLKSWAVPKGPSLDPADKRMAVHVEDHPVDYAEFEGVIPPGQYGAGTVIVWDRGAWIPEGDPRAAYRAGKLTFELRGEKLRGHWTLVRMHGNRQKDQDAWLLIKGRDEASVPITELDVVEALPDSVLSGAAGRAPRKGASARKSGKPKAAEDVPLPRGARAARLPLTLSPQLATLVETPPADEQDWRYEIKFDGYRLLARIDGKGVRLFTREGNDWTSRLQAVARDVGALGLPDGWLDGEIVVLGKHGETDFQALQNAFRTSSVDAIQYFVFDLPFYAGHDLRKVRLAQRRGLLRRLFERNTSPRLQFSEEFEAGPADMLDAACRMKLEGVIGKRADSHYVSARSKTWIKLKCTLRQEFVIGGFTDPRGSRHGIGSLLLGVHASNGHLRYAGNVGTGFDERMLSTLRAKLDGLVTDTTPFDAPPASLNVHWVRPKLVAEVSFGSWTRDGRVRHSVFHGLRSDKPASAVILEQPAEVPAGPARPSHKHKHGHKPTAAGGRVAISHADRIVDQATGITKGELVRYYERVAPLMLPHLRDRPVALVRAPDGVGGEQFFQRHGDTLRVDGIHVLDAGLWPGHPGLLEIVSAPALVAAAQLNAIEFHTWNASKRSIAKPNRIVFDLDPGKGLSWAHMREGAAMVKALLDELGLVSFLKTSGGKGLHVVVPVTPRAGWDEVKDFAHAVVLHIAQLIPQRFVAKRGAERRVGKIFIDYLRNGIGATTVAAFSVRARPGLGLSIPVGWDELESLESAAEWSVSNCGRRLEALASRDPWEAYARTRQSISRAAARLASAPG